MGEETRTARGPHDPRTAVAVDALRARIRERATAIVQDLEALHQAIDAARPLTHTAEGFEALEALDAQTWDFLDGLRELLERWEFG